VTTAARFGAFVGATCIAACSLPRGANAKHLVISGARARVLATGSGALYFSVRNTGAVPDRLERVEVTSAAFASLHEFVESAGVARMVPAPSGFAVPSFSTLVLEHGGKHVMLFGAQSGAPVLHVVAHFKNAGALRFEAPVSKGPAT